jgi:hypothetical protein
MITGLVTAAAVVLAQQRGNSGLPPGPGNPIAEPSGGTGVEGAAESNLAVIRGTVSGNDSPLQGFGYTVTAPMTLPCGTNSYPEYQITFNPPFSSPPSVVVSIHEFLSSGFSNQPVYDVMIDDQSGGITPNGFHAYIRTDGFGVTCFGSQTWDFIAIGPR